MCNPTAVRFADILNAYSTRSIIFVYELPTAQ